MRTLRATPLNEKDFSPYGDVVEATVAKEKRLINEGHTTRFHDMAQIEALGQQGRVCANIFRSDHYEMPVTIRLMERHPKGSQLFMPLSQNPYLIVVAPKGDLQEDQLRAFIVSPDQGVNYHIGTWHHHSMALGEQSDFLVIDYTDMGENVDFFELSEPIEITL